MKTYIINLIFLTFLFFTSSLYAALEEDLVLQLHSGTATEINAISSPTIGMVVYNTTDNKIYDYNGSRWVNVNAVVSTDTNNQIKVGSDSGAYLGPTAYAGFFIITAAGNKTITGIPFQPSQITFVAHVNVESLNIDSDNGVGNNINTLQNSFGTMNGFARDNGGSVTQQVIYVGGNGNSINDISRYASSVNCIGLRYGNNNGDDVGKITASFSSFTGDGFTINVVRSALASNENLVILYTAYR